MSGERKTYKVFISSTYLDNAERRKIVEDAVLRADMQPVGMERFTASVHPTVEECERQARECDIYVGIIAHRYGWIPEGKAVSITEIEYDAAKSAQRPSLMFQIDRSVPIHMERDFDEMPGRWAKQEKLDAFRAKYGKDQMPAAPFTDTTLGAKVLHALIEWRDEHEGKKPETDGAKTCTLGTTQGIDHYCTAAESQHASLPFAGFKTKLRVPIDLKDLYVPLQAMVDLRGTGESVFADASEAETKLREHGAQDLLLIEAFREASQRKRRGLVILGDPGSGKTMHSSVYCWPACDRHRSVWDCPPTPCRSSCRCASWRTCPRV